jgi:hypothetical protein
VDREHQSRGALGARTIVAGHKKSDASDKAVGSMIEGKRSYIADFAAVWETASDATELIRLMLATYEGLGNLWTLKFSAHAWCSRETAEQTGIRNSPAWRS